jgi:hypothetical protein
MEKICYRNAETMFGLRTVDCGASP